MAFAPPLQQQPPCSSRSSSLSPTETPSSSSDSLKKGSTITPITPLNENLISDRDRLHRAIEDAGSNAFGVIAVDVWLLDDNDGKFVHADGGWWRYQHFLPASPEALERVENFSLKNYVPASPQIPGAGLAGYFWSLATVHDTKCTWIDIHTITSDPDQPPYLRMQMLEEAGFGKATGVPFNINGTHKGVVLYLARPTASRRALGDETNDAFLRYAAHNIGATSALNHFRKASTTARKERVASKFRRVRTRFSVVQAFLGRYVEEKDDDEYPEKARRTRKGFKLKSFKAVRSFRRTISKANLKGAIVSTKEKVSKRCHLLVNKAAGGGLKPPPSMNWKQTVWTFFGCLVTLLSIASLLDAFNNGMVVLGPFGALMTLIYGLTPAPASQPRNALFGQSVSISIAVLMGMCDTFLPDWFRIPFAVSLAIATMSKLGITHPPAGASAVIFSTMKIDSKGYYFLLLLMGNVLAISLATLVNNLSEKRQYPIYWEFGVDSLIQGLKDHLCVEKKEIEISKLTNDSLPEETMSIQHNPLLDKVDQTHVVEPKQLLDLSNKSFCSVTSLLKSSDINATSSRYGDPSVHPTGDIEEQR
mmetsp:Transcript_28467/g.42079  ORF Transcript_28467/g.42079 Transcript_28467/m.42079 type:complete len:590 (+) Transcript_28467:189-1958(+)|eukprot:CAMPEP_0194229536 /NCGR_PEP_ID=MMETSP0156-20130528/43942_1 /TAXON_ID=33649 /ORGANISM="Thalassionema nitzschioides, Strain L26-B" /LENGTH=589 /DNA_ID=CAMNT_0038962089 /DNA_START=166 /DNA_END=1938 /DNA_ORIENTATION=+